MTAINKLLTGYKQFYDAYFRQDSELFETLAAGKVRPKTLVITCSDARVSPSLITNSKPGEIFVLRNIANLVLPYDPDDKRDISISSALEFAVCFLNVENIIILGHSKCFGIKTLMDNQTTGLPFVQEWMEVGQAARQRTLEKNPSEKNMDTLYSTCEKESIMMSLENLMTFPWIQEKVTNQELDLYGWHFCLDTGHLKVFDPQSGDFKRSES